ncbi:molecular chaperone DnaJ [Cyclobacterium plantarum]
MTIGLNRLRKYAFIFLLWMLYWPSYAQLQPNLGSTSRLMDNAVNAMENKNFTVANNYFREIIKSNLPIPPEMPYFFATTLFELGQYHNSSSFIQKYLDLNGFEGEHYDEARVLIEKLEAPLAEIASCNRCDSKGYRYQTCQTCHGEGHTDQECSLCKGLGIIGCSRCTGDGLVTKRNVFNILEYFECDRCEGKGRLTCTKCEGSLVEHGECRTCQGKGQIESEIVCNHLD